MSNTKCEEVGQHWTAQC